MRIGSLFSGYAGLDIGVRQVLGGTVAWHSDIEPASVRLLAHHYPDVPNLGDITTVDWAAVEPVDVLTGGFPCQDLSMAGKRLGLRPGTRSGLWEHMAYAVSQLRPTLVVIENVRGLLSARAHGDVEPCPWCVGDGSAEPLRALGAVLGDLAGLGYDARWVGLRAADVGAPHGRFRIFITAWPAADTGREYGQRWPTAKRGGSSGWESSDRPQQLATWQLLGGSSIPAADAERRACGERHDFDGVRGWSGNAEQTGMGGCTATDADESGPQGGEPAGRRHMPTRGTPPDPTGTGRRREPRPDVEHDGPKPAYCRPSRTAWGTYEPAIRRWERLTRPAPSPTEPGRTGQPRLSPRFVEWMQGLPDGHVTAVPDLTRNEQLKLLGNGVVPAQAAAALRHLLAAELVAA